MSERAPESEPCIKVFIAFEAVCPKSEDSWKQVLRVHHVLDQRLNENGKAWQTNLSPQPEDELLRARFGLKSVHTFTEGQQEDILVYLLLQLTHCLEEEHLPASIETATMGLLNVRTHDIRIYHEDETIPQFQQTLEDFRNVDPEAFPGQE